jgi:hypothetical protein
VDESLLLWKGHHSLKRYIPSKANRWGFKFYAVSESKTGYMYRLLLDEGKQTDVSGAISFENLQKPGQYVMSLLHPDLLNKGHRLAVDNFYTDLVLFEHLVNNKTNCLGTVRKGRRMLPNDITQAKWTKKGKGTIRSKYSKNFFAFCWMDNRAVRFLSSFGTPTIDENTKKPEIISTYNEVMPGIDLSDQKRHGRIVARRRLKRWYKKMFWHLVDVSLVNAHFYIRHVREMAKLKAEDFRIKLVRSIISKHLNRRIFQDHSEDRTTLRLVGDHYRIQSFGSGIVKNCSVCKGKGQRKRTAYYCVACNVPVCIIDCYHELHTEKQEISTQLQ